MMNLSLVQLGQQVKKYRKIKHLTQEQLAELIDKTSKHIGSIEKGKTQMSLECLVSLSFALEVTPNQLLVDSIPDPEITLDMELQNVFDECNIREKKKFLKYIHLFLEMERDTE